jgi:hypothetical protein
MNMKLVAVFLSATMVVSAGGVSASAVPSAKRYTNCKALNAVYRHGVGLPGAHDKTKSKTGPVTNFTRNAAVYNANTGRDADHDHVACEKH